MHNAYLIDSNHAGPVAHPLTLPSMQSTVGGFIAPAFTIDSPTRPGFSITGYVNDEGIMMDLPITLFHSVSPDPLCGPVLVCGLDDTTGDTAPLDASELAWIEGRTRLLGAIGHMDRAGTTSIKAVHGLYLEPDAR